MTFQKLLFTSVTMALVTPIVLAQDSTLEKTKVKSDKEQAESISLKSINAEKIDSQMMTDINDTVRYIAGVEINNTGNRFGDNGFNIRGLEGDSVAITIDGLSQGESLNPTTFSRYGMFSSTRNSVEIESIKNVKIQKGPNSIFAGSGALGGAVMYTTKDATDFLTTKDDETAGSIKFGFNGRNEETMATFSIANRINVFESLLIYTTRHGHEVKTHSDGETTVGPTRGQADPFDSEKSNILIKLKANFTPKQSVGLVYEDYENESEGTPLSRQSASYFDFETFDESNRERIGVFYNWEANLTIFDELFLSYDQQDIYTHGLTGFQFKRGSAPNYLRQEDRDYTQEMSDLSVDFTKNIRSAAEVNHSFSYGFSMTDTDVKNSLLDKRYNGATVDTGFRTRYPVIDPTWVPATKSSTFTAYINDVLEINQSFAINFGIRYDETKYKPQTAESFTDITGNAVKNSDFNAVTGAIGFNYQFNSNHRINLSYSSGFRAPTTQELYFGTNGTSYFYDANRVVDPNTGDVRYVETGIRELDYDVITNSDLDAEENSGIEINYEFNVDNFFVQISGYQTTWDNKIELINQTTPLSQPITSASLNFFNPACFAPVVSDRCWIVENLTEDSWSVPMNSGKATINGYELDLGWFINDQLNITFAYSHTQGEYDTSIEGSYNKGDKLASIAPDSAILGINYQFENTRFSWHTRYVDEKSFKDSYNATFYSDSFTISDLTASYQFNESFSLFATIQNLFDKKYSLWQKVRHVREGNGGFFGGVSEQGIDRFNEPSRNFAINLLYQF